MGVINFNRIFQCSRKQDDILVSEKSQYQNMNSIRLNGFSEQELFRTTWKK